MTEKVLITGGSGQIGSHFLNKYVREIVSSNAKIYLLQHSKNLSVQTSLDKNIQIISDLNNHTFDYAFHFAANVHTKYSDLPNRRADFIRDNVELTKQVCNKTGWVLMLSTDNVFNGMEQNHLYTEDETPSPCNGYGWTKAWAEEIVLQNKGTVVRIQTMLGISKNLIIDRIIETIEQGSTEALWDDQYVRPAFFQDLFTVIQRSATSKESSIYHCSCDGNTPSRAEIGDTVLAVYQKQNFPRKTDALAREHCTVPTFPRYLALDTTKTKQVLKISAFTTVDEAITKHVLAVKGLK